MKDLYALSVSYLETQPLKAFVNSIKAFLVNEKLEPNENLVAATLLYPPENILNALLAFDDSASWILSVTRDEVERMQYQVVTIFDHAFQEQNIWELSNEARITLERIMDKYENETKVVKSLDWGQTAPFQSGKGNFYNGYYFKN